jgi:Ca-activated chloride channel family protein
MGAKDPMQQIAIGTYIRARVVNRISMILLPLCCLIMVGCGEDSKKGVATPASRMAISGEQRWLERNGVRLAEEDDHNAGTAHNTEEYHVIRENSMVEALREPLSTFSVDVDTASYSNVRRLIRAGQLPDRGAIRLEELVNYFPYDLPKASSEHPFAVATEVAPCPWQAGHQLLRVSLAARPVTLENKKRNNLVFLLDVSGSMAAPDKLPLVKSAMKMLVDQLDAEDKISLVVYAGASGLVLDGQRVAEANAIIDAIDRLMAGGSTNGGSGIELAYKTAEKYFSAEGNNRVILCTDGDFNVGVSSESALVDLISKKAKTGVFLTVLGFGTGNIKDSKMEQLADKGNGTYAYIDSMLEARKVLVEQIGGTLETIAKDVKIQLDFNPQFIESYRLLGYENRLLANQDFRDDTKDAGEIGAGHQVTAFYEVRPVGLSQSASATDSKKSEFVKAESAGVSDTLLTVSLRYKAPQADNGREFQHRVRPENHPSAGSTEFQFAASVLGYGMLLRESEYRGTLTWDWVVETAEKNKGSDKNGIRSEFIELAKTARRIQKSMP